MPKIEVVGPMTFDNKPRQIGEVLELPERWAKIFIGLGRAKQFTAEPQKPEQNDQVKRVYKRKDMAGKTETK